MKGTALVKSFLTEHRTDMRRLFNRSTDQKLVGLRAKLIRHLYGDGLSYAEISRVLNIDPNTVRYWLIDEEKQRMMKSRRAGHERRKRLKIYYQWEECAQAMEAA